MHFWSMCFKNERCFAAQIQRLAQKIILGYARFGLYRMQENRTSLINIFKTRKTLSMVRRFSTITRNILLNNNLISGRNEAYRENVKINAKQIKIWKRCGS